MPRIRTIKPEFWTSAQILECSTNARLLFLGSWNFCDDCGRHPDSPKQLKAEVFPADDLTLAEVEALLDELWHQGLIERYESGGKRFFQVTGWHHQRIDKPQAPKYPDPAAGGSTIIQRPRQDDSGNDPGTLPPDTIGEERRGKDTKGNDTKGGDGECARSGNGARDRRFDEFWSLYPADRRKDKKKAREAWKRHNLDQHADVILLDLRHRPKRDGDWMAGFIPLPTTYLNGSRWEDAYAEPRSRGRPGNGRAAGWEQFEEGGSHEGQ